MRYIIVCSLLLAVACKDPYTPPLTYPTTGYLVVEGFINSGNGPTTIRLSRTVKPDDSLAIRSERGARVTVEGDHNSSVDLPESGDGVYIHNQLHLNGNEKYRLHITTAAGKQYVSDYESIVHTPPVDTMSWAVEREGLRIYVDTHDPQNSTHYYAWDFDETWEINSYFVSLLEYVRNAAGEPIDVVSRPAGYDYLKMFRCWVDAKSTSILTTSSTKLSEDAIHFPLLSIARGDERLSVLYSINIKQHGISRGAYDFLMKMKKNTENLGSIFDAQPSELQGNIHAVNDVTEPVVGYISVGDLQTKRFFISKYDVPNWAYRQQCEDFTFPNDPDTVKQHGFLIPLSAVGVSLSGKISAYTAAYPSCVDCTLRGYNVKPSFWP